MIDLNLAGVMNEKRAAFSLAARGVLRADDHGWAEDANDGGAAGFDGFFGFAFDAGVAGHPSGAGASGGGGGIGTDGGHEGQVADASRCLEGAREGSVWGDVDGAVLVDGELGGAGADSQTLRPTTSPVSEPMASRVALSRLAGSMVATCFSRSSTPASLASATCSGCERRTRVTMGLQARL